MNTGERRAFFQSVNKNLVILENCAKRMETLMHDLQKTKVKATAAMERVVSAEQRLTNIVKAAI